MGIDATVVAKAAEEAAAKLNAKLSVSSEKQPEEETETATEEDEEKAGETSKEGEEKETEEAPETEEEEAEEEEAGEDLPKASSKTVPMARFNEVYGRLKQMERTMQLLMDTQKTPPEAASKKEEVVPPDFENMSQKELATWMVQTISKGVDEKIGKMIQPIVETQRQELANKDVTACAGRHTDYFTYAPKMIELANRYRMLGAEEIYTLAKGAKGSKEQMKDIASKLKEKVNTKKKARVEKRSSPADKTTVKEYKTVRDAGLAVAEKLGIK